jgi:uncharacterized protein YjbI with pentapeptide repeats
MFFERVIELSQMERFELSNREGESMIVIEGEGFKSAVKSEVKKWKEKNNPMCFSGLDLSNKDFSGLNLENIIFFAADLSNSDFSNTILTGADFRLADTTGTDFDGATIDGAIGLSINPE